MQRSKYDIGKLLCETVDVHTLKTDEHAKGVFFTDGHGYLLNKVWGVRIKHHDHPCEKLFYSFLEKEEDGSNIVEERYPYCDLKLKPKKHFLLFDSEEIRKNKINQIFEADNVLLTIQCTPNELHGCIPEITNRRDREKTIAKIKIQNQTLQSSVYKHLKNIKREHFANVSIKCFYREEEKTMLFLINAFTLRTVLELFLCYNMITLLVTEKKIIITGEGDDIQVVIARMK